MKIILLLALAFPTFPMIAGATDFETRKSAYDEAARRAAQRQPSRTEILNERELKRVDELANRYGGSLNVSPRYYELGHELAGELAWVDFNTGDGHACRLYFGNSVAECFDAQNEKELLRVSWKRRKLY